MERIGLNELLLLHRHGNEGLHILKNWGRRFVLHVGLHHNGGRDSILHLNGIHSRTPGMIKHIEKMRVQRAHKMIKHVDSRIIREHLIAIHLGLSVAFRNQIENGSLLAVFVAMARSPSANGNNMFQRNSKLKEPLS